MTKPNRNYIDYDVIRREVKNTCLSEFVEICSELHRTSSSKRRDELVGLISNPDESQKAKDAARYELFFIFVPLLLNDIIRNSSHVNPSSLEDYMQEAMLILWKVLANGRKTTTILPYVYRIYDIVVHQYDKQAQFETVSLSDWLMETQEEQLLTIAPDSVFDMEDVLLQSVAIDTALKTLKPREEDAIRRRFGLPPYYVKHGLSEIANAYGIASSEGARRIVNDGLRHLRHPSRSKYIKDLPGNNELFRKLCEVESPYSSYSQLRDSSACHTQNEDVYADIDVMF